MMSLLASVVMMGLELAFLPGETKNTLSWKHKKRYALYHPLIFQVTLPELAPMPYGQVVEACSAATLRTLDRRVCGCVRCLLALEFRRFISPGNRSVKGED